VRLRTPTTLLIVLAAGFGAGCGSDEEPKPSIPQDSTTALLRELTSIQNRFDFGDGACNDIPGNKRSVNDIISRLPSSVDADVRNALQDSFDHLFDLTADQCDKTKGQDTDTETETTPTTETTETTDTTTTETETTDTQTETQPTETEPTDTGTVPTTPPDDGSGGAQGPGL
jgi:hypothetical protein